MVSPKRSKPRQNILRPSMRDKKRYVAFEITSAKPLPVNADRLLSSRINDLLGLFNASKAGLINVKFNSTDQRGLLRVDRKFVDFVRCCFVIIKSLNNQDVRIRTLRVSGMLNKASIMLKPGEYS